MKKMVLVPYEQYTHQNQKQLPPIIKSKESIENSEEKSPSVNISETSSQAHSKPERLSSDRILQGFGKIQKNKARTLLSYVDHDMDWNDKGELITDNVTHTGSHMTDLLRDALSNSKGFTPVGSDIFYTQLQYAPKSLFHPSKKSVVGAGNTEKGQTTEELISERNRSPPPPPPGIPTNNNKPVDLSDPFLWRNKWRKI